MMRRGVRAALVLGANRAIANEGQPKKSRGSDYRWKTGAACVVAVVGAVGALYDWEQPAHTPLKSLPEAFADRWNAGYFFEPSPHWQHLPENMWQHKVEEIEKTFDFEQDWACLVGLDMAGEEETLQALGRKAECAMHVRINKFDENDNVLACIFDNHRESYKWTLEGARTQEAKRLFMESVLVNLTERKIRPTLLLYLSGDAKDISIVHLERGIKALAEQVPYPRIIFASCDQSLIGSLKDEPRRHVFHYNELDMETSKKYFLERRRKKNLPALSDDDLDILLKRFCRHTGNLISAVLSADPMAYGQKEYKDLACSFRGTMERTCPERQGTLAARNYQKEFTKELSEGIDVRRLRYVCGGNFVTLADKANERDVESWFISTYAENKKLVGLKRDGKYYPRCDALTSVVKDLNDLL